MPKLVKTKEDRERLKELRIKLRDLREIKNSTITELRNGRKEKREILAKYKK